MSMMLSFWWLLWFLESWILGGKIVYEGNCVGGFPYYWFRAEQFDSLVQISDKLDIFHVICFRFSLGAYEDIFVLDRWSMLEMSSSNIYYKFLSCVSFNMFYLGKVVCQLAETYTLCGYVHIHDFIGTNCKIVWFNE
jgi:hypothetical protein